MECEGIILETKVHQVRDSDRLKINDDNAVKEILSKENNKYSFSNDKMKKDGFPPKRDPCQEREIVQLCVIRAPSAKCVDKTGVGKALSDGNSKPVHIGAMINKESDLYGSKMDLKQSKINLSGKLVKEGLSKVLVKGIRKQTNSRSDVLKLNVGYICIKNASPVGGNKQIVEPEKTIGENTHNHLEQVNLKNIQNKGQHSVENSHCLIVSFQKDNHAKAKKIDESASPEVNNYVIDEPLSKDCLRLKNTTVIPERMQSLNKENREEVSVFDISSDIVSSEVEVITEKDSYESIYTEEKGDSSCYDDNTSVCNDSYIEQENLSVCQEIVLDSSESSGNTLPILEKPLVPTTISKNDEIILSSNVNKLSDNHNNNLTSEEIEKSISFINQRKSLEILMVDNDGNKTISGQKTKSSGIENGENTSEVNLTPRRSLEITLVNTDKDVEKENDNMVSDPQSETCDPISRNSLEITLLPPSDESVETENVQRVEKNMVDTSVHLFRGDSNLEITLLKKGEKSGEIPLCESKMKEEYVLPPDSLETTDQKHHKSLEIALLENKFGANSKIFPNEVEVKLDTSLLETNSLENFNLKQLPPDIDRSSVCSTFETVCDTFINNVCKTSVQGAPGYMGNDNLSMNSCSNVDFRMLPHSSIESKFDNSNKKSQFGLDIPGIVIEAIGNSGSGMSYSQRIEAEEQAVRDKVDSERAYRMSRMMSEEATRYNQGYTPYDQTQWRQYDHITQVVDSTIVETYNNFIHFMVPETVAMSLNWMGFCKEKETSEKAETCNRPVEQCCPTVVSEQGSYSGQPMGQLPMLLSQKPLHPPPPLLLGGPPQPSYLPFYQYPLAMAPYPAVQQPVVMSPLPIDPTSQLTITPLDQVAKQFPPGQPTSSVYPLTPQQLTITPLANPLYQSYKMKPNSGVKRRGRPPLDPDYDSVGYKRELYSPYSFPQADYMSMYNGYMRSLAQRDHFDQGRYPLKTNTPYERFNTGYFRKILPSPSVDIFDPARSTRYHGHTAFAEQKSSPSHLLDPKDQFPENKPQTEPSDSISCNDALLNDTREILQNSSQEKSEHVIVVTDSDDQKTTPVESLVESAVAEPSTCEQKEAIETIADASADVSKKETVCETTNVPSDSLVITVEKSKVIKEKDTHDPQTLKIIPVSSPNLVRKEPFLSTLKYTHTESKVNITEPKDKDVHSCAKITPLDNSALNKESKPTLKLSIPASDNYLITNYSENIKVINKNIKVINTDFKTPEETFSSTLKISHANDSIVSAKPSTSTFIGTNSITVSKSQSIKKGKKMKTKRKVFSKPLNKKNINPLKRVPATKSVASNVNNNNKSETIKVKVQSACEMDVANCVNNEIIDSAGNESSVRRSCRKRKIIEGNPKFKDMERVDLKRIREFREDEKVRVMKKKMVTKGSAELKEARLKKLALVKQQERAKLELAKRLEAERARRLEAEQVKLREAEQVARRQHEHQLKLKKFLDMNDIYLKPQTFV